MAGNNIARVYATALLDVGKSNNVLDQLHEELGFVSTLLSEEQDFKSYLTSPSFSKDAKKEFINRVFSGNLSEYTVNFINVLIENGRQVDIPDINNTFSELIDELNNRMKVEVISVIELDDATIDHIKSALKEKFGKDIILEVTVDESILGGIIIKAGDLVIDGSLAENLKKIRYNLLNSKVRSEVAYED